MDKQENIVYIPDGNIVLTGSLEIPDRPLGIVLFAHGSGSSRLSPRNVYVAEALRKRGFGTLLMDLLTFEEDLDHERRFDIELLSHRLLVATRWLQKQDKAGSLPVGYFGASTGAAAAIQAAASLGEQIRAVVSRGGRPDLAWEYLEEIKSPTLLLVGGNDDVVIELNQKAYERINAVKKMEIVAEATHLFEEPGTLETVADLAGDWFEKHLPQTLKETHVVTCFLENQGNVLLLKRSAKVGTYQQRWAGVSGYIEPGNTPMQQAWQELSEEAGVDSSQATLLKEGDVLVITDEDLGKKWIVHPFRFLIQNRDRVKLDWENMESIWIDPEQMPDYKTVPGLFSTWEMVR